MEDWMTDRRAQIEALIREYRTTMGIDVLHSWASDAIKMLRALTPADPQPDMAALREALARVTAERDAAVAGRVKPLVWEDADEGMCTKWRAPALGGSYDLVSFEGEDGFAVNFYWGRPLSFWFIQGAPDEFGPTGPKMFPTLDAAKAAAQADYEARILAALHAPEPAPADDVVSRAAVLDAVADELCGTLYASNRTRLSSAIRALPALARAFAAHPAQEDRK